MLKEPRSLGIRLWHWLDLAAIVALLSTVLLRDTLLSPRANAALLQDKLAGAGATVSTEQARAGGHGAGRERLWVWHVYAGYGLAVLRGAVWLLERRRRPTVGAGTAAARASRHYRLVKAFHASFYVALAVMVVRGWSWPSRRLSPWGSPWPAWSTGSTRT